MMQSEGYEVVSLDAGYFSPCSLFDDTSPPVTTVTKDIRDVERPDLEGFDAVIHLAALSNDPIGNLNNAWTEEINFQASVKLAQLAKAAGVKRFLFSSSCIMYGVSEMNVVTEESPLDPKTEYARSKVKAERGISQLGGNGFCPVFLRNGTVYGLSARMRVDTVFNDLIGSAVAMGKVTVYSGGKPWRPVVHVEDLARAFITVLEAPEERVHNQAFNIGADNLNTQVMRLAEIAIQVVPGAELEILNNPGADQRTYWTDFSKFSRTFPDFRFRWTPEEGGRQLSEALRQIRFTNEQFTDKRFTRIKWLKHLLQSQQLDLSLRWPATVTSAAL
jgi:nucleoside-diphosphate-sugar epimerase